MAWDYAQYVLGLARLGHDVYFVEDSNDWPACYHPATNTFDCDPAEGLSSAAHTFLSLGIGERWAYYDAHTNRWIGPCAEGILALCESADLLLNVSGWANTIRPWLLQIPVRAFLDTDPGFTQIVHLTDPKALANALLHNVHFSFGENYGLSGCRVPADGFRWQATRQPVVLDQWPATPGKPEGNLTTIMFWESYPAREYRGVYYGLKSDSFIPYFSLPARVTAQLQLAVGRIPDVTLKQVQNSGWDVIDPLIPSRDVRAYRSFIQDSKGEFGVAKHCYVITRSGWFSGRSAMYLASGRPVVIEDTGFSHWMHTGAGVIPFSNPDEAVAGIEDVSRRYEYHCKAAREIAIEYFDSNRVLSDLIEKAMNFS